MFSFLLAMLNSDKFERWLHIVHNQNAYYSTKNKCLWLKDCTNHLLVEKGLISPHRSIITCENHFIEYIQNLQPYFNSKTCETRKIEGNGSIIYNLNSDFLIIGSGVEFLVVYGYLRINRFIAKSDKLILVTLGPVTIENLSAKFVKFISVSGNFKISNCSSAAVSVNGLNRGNCPTNILHNLDHLTKKTILGIIRK